MKTGTMIGSAAVILTAVALSGGGAVDTYTAPPPAAAAPIAAASCAGPIPGLTDEQADVARRGIAAAHRAGTGTEGATIIVAAGLVESELRNLDHGDRDSLGWLQQRPSKGWKHARDVDKAADDFFADLTGRVKNWRMLDPGKAAQAVQRSGYPDRYGQRMGQARGIVTAAGTGCANPGPAPAAAAVGDCPATGNPSERGLQPAALRGLRCGAHAWPELRNFGGKGGRPNKSDHPAGRAVDFMIPSWHTPTGNAYGWDVARWWAEHAAEFHVTYVIWDDKMWRTRKPSWEPYTHPNGPTLDATLRHLDHVHVSYR